MNKIVLLLCIGVGMLACSPDEEENPKVIADISDDFYISLWENLELPARTFALQVETIDEQTCTNTLIDYSFRRTESALSLSFNDILEPHPNECDEGPTTIRTPIELGFLPEGTYDMQINLKNAVVNNGLLKVRSDVYQLDMYSDDGFHLQQTELQRVPENMFWGYVAYRETESSASANTILDDLEEAGKKLSLKSGYYGHFTVQDDQSLTLNEVPPNKYIKTFAHGFSENHDAIQTLLADFRAEYGDQLELKIFTDTGEVW